MSFLVSLALGVCSVMQAGLNRKVALKFDLTSATFFSSAVLFVFSALLFFSSGRKSFGRAFAGLEAWQVLPGLFGIVLVAGIPWAISKWGATPVFVGLVTSQVLSSFVWDAVVEKSPPGFHQVSGAALSLLGFVIVSRGGF